MAIHLSCLNKNERTGHVMGNLALKPLDYQQQCLLQIFSGGARGRTPSSSSKLSKDPKDDIKNYGFIHLIKDFCFIIAKKGNNELWIWTASASSICRSYGPPIKIKRCISISDALRWVGREVSLHPYYWLKLKQKVEHHMVGMLIAERVGYGDIELASVVGLSRLMCKCLGRSIYSALYRLGTE